MKRHELPKPYRDLIRKRSKPIADLEPPLVNAFYWSDTPEGHAFWHAVYVAKTVEDLPAIPQKEEAA